MLAVGYPIWTFCANAAETASEARVRNDANFILDQTGREAVVNTGGGASSRKRSGRILASESFGRCFIRCGTRPGHPATHVQMPPALDCTSALKHNV